jgi:hypothetical protein
MALDVARVFFDWLGLSPGSFFFDVMLRASVRPTNFRSVRRQKAVSLRNIRS